MSPLPQLLHVQGPRSYFTSVCKWARLVVLGEDRRGTNERKGGERQENDFNLAGRLQFNVRSLLSIILPVSQVITVSLVNEENRELSSVAATPGHREESPGELVKPTCVRSPLPEIS